MAVALGTGAAACGFLSLLALAELASRRWDLRPETGRKVAHVSCGVLAASLSAALGFPAIVLLASGFVPFMVVSRRMDLFPVVHAGERTTRGEIYFPVGVLLTALFVPEDVPYTFGILVLALADAVAAVLGERFGRRAYHLLGAHKTYVGSASFFAAALVLALVALDGRVAAAVGIAGVLTVEEGLLGGGTDNVVLPVSAAALLHAAL